MKITVRELRKIVFRTLASTHKRVNEDRIHPAFAHDLNGVSAEALLAFAKAYRSMGDAVTEQLWKLMDDPDANLNSNAVELIKQTLGGCNEEIDQAIAAWEEHRGGEFDPEDDGSLAFAAKINGLK